MLHLSHLLKEYAMIKLNYRQQESLWAYLFVLPAVLGLLLLVAFPFGFGFWTSLTDWDAYSPPSFIGLANYRRLFAIREPQWFPDTIWNTFFFVAMGPVGIALSLVLALLVNTDLRLNKLFRALFFLPTITSSAVISLVWFWLYDTNFGLLNWLLGLIGIDPIPWLLSERYAKLAIWIMLTWLGSGSGMMVQLSALQGIPQEILEAATIDGAGAVQKFFSITLPLLTPVLFFQFVMTTIGAFQLFGPVLMLTQGSRDTMTAVYYVYSYAFGDMQWGFASAGAYLLAIVIGIFTIIQFVAQKRWVYYES
jgi:multiple sugar transport system permease protein